MKYNNKVIIVNGMQRGGTNIVWNLLQSHPKIVSPGLETGELLFPAWASNRLFKPLKAPLRLLLSEHFPPLLKRLDRVLYENKMRTLQDDNNKYKNPKEIYTREELEDAALTAKSVGDDIFFTPAMSDYFPQAYVIYVVRNGLAVCEGWVRRGVTPSKAAHVYKKLMEEVVHQSNHLENHLIVNFEDCLSDPMGQAVRMYKFVGLDAKDVKHIRIKSKKIIQDNGTHETDFAKAGQKIWLDPEGVKDYLDASITQRQIDRLSVRDKETIVRIIGPTMQKLGYGS
ncbi:sulfotransferase [Natronospirillum operosum]|uniref:Sulfotransferase n=1 Tax=Natronospirillum operosum TaxID=2759953 RepID=A0A4Z0WJA1_9GAMM|nr:sulfotransferase [Natronospirillum operosum]TGG95255.1 sulfotransferase [Natronospirillum operosum]